ncbi:MAG TPA: SRPBCC family protein [Thermoanaerobaculia bacterium]|nr:SRPBCC family protein [Thermoanaerobaculia bacterium]
MADYAFITQWWFDAPIERVWETIRQAERWPSWWRSVAAVEKVSPGDASGVGEVRRFTWRGRLPYSLSFQMKTTRVEAPTTLEGVATGELEGTGRWRLAPESGGTAVRYDWNVRATKLWMRLLAPLARPLFVWNHDAVMRDGERGLRRLLEGKA